jgi:hypothetical protein
MRLHTVAALHHKVPKKRLNEYQRLLYSRRRRQTATAGPSQRDPIHEALKVSHTLSLNNLHENVHVEPRQGVSVTARLHQQIAEGVEPVPKAEDR